MAIKSTIKPLNEKAKKGAYLASLDYKNVEIALELGVSNNTVTNWSKRQDWKDLVQENLKNQLKDLAKVAMKNLQEFLNSENPKIKYDATKMVLDKAGFNAVAEVKTSGEQSINISFSYEDDDEESDSIDLEEDGI